jgi:hypothetical protein
MTMKIVGQVWKLCSRTAVPTMAVTIPASARVAALKAELVIGHLHVISSVNVAAPMLAPSSSSQTVVLDSTPQTADASNA